MIKILTKNLNVKLFWEIVKKLSPWISQTIEKVDNPNSLSLDRYHIKTCYIQEYSFCHQRSDR